MRAYVYVRRTFNTHTYDNRIIIYFSVIAYRAFLPRARKHDAFFSTVVVGMMEHNIFFPVP